MPTTTAANPRRAFGDMGERLAAQHLQSKGYRIRALNHRTAEGEIDIIAERDDAIAFIEVKSRRGARMGTAIDAITPAKQRKLIALAECYAAEYTPDSALTIDVIAIDFTPDGRLLSLVHHENAVTGDL
ncbi:MAG: YraN family protein [Chloroflexota bacterium]